MSSIKKSFAGLMIAAFVFAGFATPAKAQTVAELQALINQLMSQIAAMQGGSNTNTCTGAYVHSMTLKQGSTGSQVAAMQGVIGAIADGNFGPATKAKVATFQSQNGLTADGVVGPATGAKLAMASTANCGGSNNGGGSSNNSGSLQGGAGDITISSSSQFNNETAKEDDTTEVLAFDIEADDESDVMISSIKVEFAQNEAGASDKLDDYVESVSVWFDGEKVGEDDVEDFSENNDVWTKSISLDGVVIEAGDEERLVVAVTAINNLDSADIAAAIMRVGVSSVRFMDGDGVISTDSLALNVSDQGLNPEAGTIIRTFDFEDESADESLEIKSSSNDPDQTTLKVEDDEKSEWYEIFVFKLAGEENDIDLEELVLTVSMGTADFDAVVSDIKIEIDGDEFSYDQIADGDTDEATVTFDIDGDFTIDADEDVEVSVMVEFNDQDGNYVSGSETISVEATFVEGEGMDTVDDTSTISSETHTLSLSVAKVVVKSITESTNDAGDTGFINFVFEVDATDSDEAIVFDTTSGAGAGTLDGAATGLTFDVLGAGSSTQTLVKLSGDATFAAGTGVWTVQDGDKATFGLNFTISDAGTTYVELQTVSGITVDEISDAVNLSA